MGAACKLESTGSHFVLGILSTFVGMAGFCCSSIDHARAGKAGAVACDVAIWISLSKVAKVLERPVEAEYEWFGVRDGTRL